MSFFWLLRKVTSSTQIITLINRPRIRLPGCPKSSFVQSLRSMSKRSTLLCIKLNLSTRGKPLYQHPLRTKHCIGILLAHLGCVFIRRNIHFDGKGELIYLTWTSQNNQFCAVYYRHRSANKFLIFQSPNSIIKKQQNTMTVKSSHMRREKRFNCSKFALKNTVSRTVEDFGKASNLYGKGHGKLERFPLRSIILSWLCNAIF